jgi:hypothetical protein
MGRQIGLQAVYAEANIPNVRRRVAKTGFFQCAAPPGSDSINTIK